jgi:hypothetical protein
MPILPVSPGLPGVNFTTGLSLATPGAVCAQLSRFWEIPVPDRIQTLESGLHILSSAGERVDGMTLQVLGELKERLRRGEEVTREGNGMAIQTAVMALRRVERPEAAASRGAPRAKVTIPSVDKPPIAPPAPAGQNTQFWYRFFPPAWKTLPDDMKAGLRIHVGGRLMEISKDANLQGRVLFQYVHDLLRKVKDAAEKASLNKAVKFDGGRNLNGLNAVLEMCLSAWTKGEAMAAVFWEEVEQSVDFWATVRQLSSRVLQNTLAASERAQLKSVLLRINAGWLTRLLHPFLPRAQEARKSRDVTALGEEKLGQDLAVHLKALMVRGDLPEVEKAAARLATEVLDPEAAFLKGFLESFQRNDLDRLSEILDRIRLSGRV